MLSIGNENLTHKLRIIGVSHKGRTYIESDRMMSSAPMESADQAAWPGGRASTTMVVQTLPPPEQSEPKFLNDFERWNRFRE